MKTIEINDDGDWTLQVIDEAAGLIQNLKHLIYERLGEWFLNEEHGFRVEVLQEKHYSESEIVQALYDAMYQEPRVLEVIKLDYDFNRLSRHLIIDFQIDTTLGTLESRGEFDVDTRGL